MIIKCFPFLSSRHDDDRDNQIYNWLKLNACKSGVEYIWVLKECWYIDIKDEALAAMFKLKFDI
jgi:hypothetical protein